MATAPITLLSANSKGNWDENGLVHGLINEQTRTWNFGLLNEIFNEEVAMVIGSIPVSRLGLEDTMVWHFHQTGIYTVHSGYKLLTGMETGSANQGMDINREAWLKIWKVNVPSKIRVFMWRVNCDA